MADPLLNYNFTPIPLLNGPWRQTILARYWPQIPSFQYTDHYFVDMEDGDQLSILENKPKNWVNGQRICVLVHGLTGSADSTYMTRIARRLCSQGYNVIRVNMRNAGLGLGHAKKLTHAGRSNDTRLVLHWLKRKYSLSPVTQIGFSLGGNITLKMAGEDGVNPSGNLDSVVAISPPICLKDSVKHLQQPENVFFDHFFVNEILKDVENYHNHFIEVPMPEFPEAMNFEDFDNIYTAPMCGFRDAIDYYEKSSSKQYLEYIKVPCRILSAQDDPIVCHKSYSNLQLPPNLHLELSSGGGHLGFLGFSKRFVSTRYMDDLILLWTNSFGGL